MGRSYTALVSRALVERYWRAQDPYDPATLGDVRHPAWWAEWPQSNERVPSHEADVAIHTAYSDYPAHALSRLAGSDEAWQPMLAAARHLFDENAVIDRPQRGRRVVGVSGIARVHEAQRELLPGRIRRVSASGHVLVVESLVRLSGPHSYRVDILEFAGDKVVKGREYFAEALPATEWRRALVERTTEGAW